MLIIQSTEHKQHHARSPRVFHGVQIPQNTNPMLHSVMDSRTFIYSETCSPSTASIRSALFSYVHMSNSPNWPARAQLTRSIFIFIDPNDYTRVSVYWTSRICFHIAIKRRSSFACLVPRKIIGKLWSDNCQTKVHGNRVQCLAHEIWLELWILFKRH